MAMPVPPALAAGIDGALAEAEARARPAPAKVLMAFVEQLSRYAEDFGLKAPPARNTAAWERIGRVYREVFEDVPADLVGEAFRRWRRRGTSFGKLPEPGAVREEVVEDVARRRLIVLRLETARRMLRQRERVET